MNQLDPATRRHQHHRGCGENRSPDSRDLGQQRLSHGRRFPRWTSASAWRYGRRNFFGIKPLGTWGSLLQTTKPKQPQRKQFANCLQTVWLFTAFANCLAQLSVRSLHWTRRRTYQGHQRSLWWKSLHRLLGGQSKSQNWLQLKDLKNSDGTKRTTNFLRNTGRA